MNIKWYKGLSSKDRQGKEERKQLIETASSVFEILTGILEREIELLQKERDSKENFTLPAYAEMQAHYSGRIAALKKVVQLITIKES